MEKYEKRKLIKKTNDDSSTSDELSFYLNALENGSDTVDQDEADVMAQKEDFLKTIKNFNLKKVKKYLTGATLKYGITYKDLEELQKRVIENLENAQDVDSIDWDAAEEFGNYILAIKEDVDEAAEEQKMHSATNLSLSEWMEENNWDPNSKFGAFFAYWLAIMGEKIESWLNTFEFFERHPVGRKITKVLFYVTFFCFFVVVMFAVGLLMAIGEEIKKKWNEK